jgi:hypothetical protein
LQLPFLASARLRLIMAGPGARRQQEKPEGPASLFAIGTAVPPFVHEQSTYPDYYFDVTNSNHKTELKAKFKRICKCTHHLAFI